MAILVVQDVILYRDIFTRIFLFLLHKADYFLDSFDTSLARQYLFKTFFYGLVRTSVYSGHHRILGFKEFLTGQYSSTVPVSTAVPYRSVQQYRTGQYSSTVPVSTAVPCRSVQQYRAGQYSSTVPVSTAVPYR